MSETMLGRRASAPHGTLVEVCAAQLMLFHGIKDSEALAFVVRVIQQAEFGCSADGSIWWLDPVHSRAVPCFLGSQIP